MGSKHRRVAETTLRVAGSILLVVLAACSADGSGERAPDRETVATTPDSNEAVRLEVNRENREIVVLVGPLDLPTGAAGGPVGAAHAAGEHGAGSHGAVAPVFNPVEIVRFPFDLFLHGLSYELVDASGEPLPRELLHHVNFIDPVHRELFLPISRRVAASGQDTKAASLPGSLVGYPIEAGQPMVVTGMFHNPTGERLTGVTLRFRFKYVPAGRPWPLFEAYPFWVDVAFPAGDKAHDLPPGRSQRSYEVSPAVGGRIMGVSGHLHAHGDSLRFVDVTEDRVIWSASPVENERDEVRMPVGHLYRRLGAEIHPSHTYRLTAFYDNPTGDTIRRGAMGALGGLFVPSGDAWEATVDTTAALYRLDRAHYMRRIRGPFEEVAAEGVLKRYGSRSSSSGSK